MFKVSDYASITGLQSLRGILVLCFLNLPEECRYVWVRCLRITKHFYPRQSFFYPLSCIILVAIQALALAK